ncbi:MAG: phosphomannomutase/phosphoglucomutase, partial [Hydrogeniiclostridium mannosilyticum]
LGIIFDTDVDRAGAVDRTGKEINRNRLVALASAIALEGNPGGAIVTDSITSTGLKTYIEQELGGVHYRYKRGYKNVIDEAVRLNRAGVNCPLAIETSGHAAFRENDFLDDGAYLVTKLIIKMAVLRREGKALEDLLAGLAEPVETAELRLAIRAEDFRAYGKRVIEELERFSRKQSWDIAPDNREGIRVSFPKGHGNGWFLLRLSVHDPIMPLNIESDSVGGAKEIAVQLYAFLRLAEKLDVSPLEAFLAR